MKILFVILILAVGLGLVLSRVARKIPTAYAWDPNSHDKMTLFALNLLEQEEKKTLLGWVLHLSRHDPVGKLFKHGIESQIRRGSVEEDMNSYLLTRVTYSHGGLDTLEGANGGYHFFNPKRTDGQGLTDPTFFLTLLGKIASCCASPMPSAVERAFISSVTNIKDAGWEGWAASKYGETPSSSWHLDNEYRNYSVQNASSYYRLGYSHLGFYAIGRIAHLLQDMAVPAHVRDDAHPGGAVEKAGFDPSDPLEQYADLQDKAVAESETHLHKWAFDPDRLYDSSQSPIFSASQGIWLALSEELSAPTPELFKRLSGITYDNHYSYNTIPGNANSHNPDQTAIKPLVRTDKVDWQKCSPSSDGLLEVFREFLSEAQTICLELAKDIRNLGNPSDWDRPKAVKYQGLMAKIPALSDPIKSVKLRTWKYQDIVGLGPKYHFPAPSLPAMISGLDGLYNEIRPIGDELGSIIHRTAQSFVNRYELMDLPGLLAAFEKAESPRPPEADRDHRTEAIIRNWIDAFPDHQVLCKIFDVRVMPWSSLFQEIKNNGPCCLSEELIREQWLRTQPYGVGFTAILLSSWFERQFHTMGGHGLVTWQNKDAGDSQTKPVIEPLAGELNSSAMTADKAATIGMAHRLPLALDLAVEITLLEEGTDTEVWEEGVELELTWGRSRTDNFIKLLGFDMPENIFYPEPGTAGGTVDPGIGHDWFKRKNCFAENLRSYVMQEGREGLTWFIQNLGPLVFCGKENDSSSKTATTIHPLAADPYNLEAMLRLPLARGIWSREYSEMGGISREDELNAEKFPPLELFGDDASTNKKICAGFLRLVARTPNSQKPAPGSQTEN
jgi:hypothetical protein